MFAFENISNPFKPSVVTHACNPSSWEAEAEGLKRVPGQSVFYVTQWISGQPGLQTESLFQKQISLSATCRGPHP